MADHATIASRVSAARKRPGLVTPHTRVEGFGMEFADILEQTIALLQHQGRISYGALKRRFGLDDAYLEDLKICLLYTSPSPRDS